MSLDDLISQNGTPKAIINCPEGKTKKIIFNFDETICLNDKGVLIVNGKEKKINALDSWQLHLEQWKSNIRSNEIAAVGFFSYDFKNMIYPKYNFNKKSNKKTPYFWFGKPEKVIEISNSDYNFEKQTLKLKGGLQDIKQYKEKINTIKDYLYSGDVYQINYTQPITFNINGNPIDLYIQIEKDAKSKYGFYLDIEQMQILSFSPEKFFTLKKQILKSYPIKGTIKRSDNQKEDQKNIQILSKYLNHLLQSRDLEL